MTWAATSVGQLVASGALEFGDGYRTKRSEHGQPGYRIIRVADVSENNISFDGPDFVANKFAKAIGSKAGQTGDILLTTKGTVGRVAVMPSLNDPVVYSPQLCYFRVTDSTRINSRFLRFWFSSPEFWSQAADRMNNTDMAAYINMADIRSLMISLPDFETQQAIADVLGALDDKIAANTKLAAIADQLATALFHEALTNAEWSDKTFADIAQVSGGGTPNTKTPENWDGDIPWATPTDITALIGPYLESTSRTISTEGFSACASPLYPKGSILMTSRATIGAFAMAQIPTAVNQGFIVVQPIDPTTNYWVFHEMRSRVDEFISLANGATFLELSRGNFKKFKVRLADIETMQSFEIRAKNLHAVARHALEENAAIVHARDTLLPKLMSGSVCVGIEERQTTYSKTY